MEFEPMRIRGDGGREIAKIDVPKIGCYADIRRAERALGLRKHHLLRLIERALRVERANLVRHRAKHGECPSWYKNACRF